MAQSLYSHLKLSGRAQAGKALKSLLGPNTAAIVTRTPNGLFATDPEDMGVGREIRKHGCHAGGEELERLLGYINSDDRVLIVGTHIGTLAIPIAQHCKSVVAIEANRDTFALLQLNLLLNNVGNVRACNIAASQQTETIEFVSSRSNSGGSKRMPKVRAAEYFYDAPKTVSVKAHALDDYLSDESFSFVLIDIEGSEYFALKGMSRILSEAKTLVIEYLPHHLRNVSGVSPEEFVSLISPHFERLYIASKELEVGKPDFVPVLRAMYDKDEGDEGLIFTK